MAAERLSYYRSRVAVVQVLLVGFLISAYMSVTHPQLYEQNIDNNDHLHMKLRYALLRAQCNPSHQSDENERNNLAPIVFASKLEEKWNRNELPRTEQFLQSFEIGSWLPALGTKPQGPSDGSQET